MTEKTENTTFNSNFQQDIIPSENFSEENFFSSQIRPENIFCEHPKENSEVNLSSKILSFPFTLKFYELILIKDETDPELNDSFCSLILGDFKNVRYNESILKMIFFSKDQRTSLNLLDYITEIKSLKNISGIEFIYLCKNKIFIQFENENITKENFTSLQKSYNLLNLLYDEDFLINNSSYDELNKDYKDNKDNKDIQDNSSSEKKFNEDFKYIDDLLSSEKKVKKIDFNDENENSVENSPNKDLNKDENIKYNPNESDSFKNPEQNNNNMKINIPKKTNKNINNQNPQSTQTNQKFIHPLFNPKLFPQYNNISLNNFQKMNQQINPLLFYQLSKINPLVLQTTFLMQNMIKMQQMNQKINEKKNNNNFNGKNNIFNNETEKIQLPKKTKEFSPKSKTSSTTSSQESSPATNYQDKTNFNNINNMNIHSINFELFNGFNNNIQIPNLNNNNNFNQINNYNDPLNDILNISESDSNFNIKSDSSQKSNEAKDNIKNQNNISNDYNLEKIVLDNKYKEFIPKKNNQKDMQQSGNNPNSKNNNNIINLSNFIKTNPQKNYTTPLSQYPNPHPLEKDVQFHTNSTRDYQYKYVSRYIVQIENDKNFPVTRMIIGNSGKLLRDILVENCIKFGDYTTKIRLRGKGSGYKEGPKNEESNDPLELCLSSLNMFSYVKCSNEIENLLKKVYYQYYLYQLNNKDKNSNEPIVMKKILKYPYVVNRFNTLVKEEKRRKKEEELKQVNLGNNNNNNISGDKDKDNNNDNFNNKK